MPTTIFDWIARTAMLVMAGLVTLSILGAIATMTDDAGNGFPGGERPLLDADRAREREAAPAPAPAPPAQGNVTAEGSSAVGSVAAVAARPPEQDEEARWLEAIAYALLAIAGIGALGVLMLWSMLRELRRIGGMRP